MIYGTFEKLRKSTLQSTGTGIPKKKKKKIQSKLGQIHTDVKITFTYWWKKMQREEKESRIT